MTTKQYILGAVILVVGLVAVLLFKGGTAPKLGSQVQNDIWSFSSGIDVSSIGGNDATAPIVQNTLSSVVTTGKITSGQAVIVSVLNPFKATSTVDLAKLNITLAPTTALFGASTYTCGTSSTATGQPTATLISSGAVASGTLAYLINGVVYTASGGTPGNGNARIGVGPAEYVNCYLSTAQGTIASTTEQGDYDIRWFR